MKLKHIFISYFNCRLNVISVSEEEACKFESTGTKEVKSIINYNDNHKFPRLIQIYILFNFDF